MLKRLSVENYALIEGLEMELSPRLNIVTGETGAGKSILLGALGLILGNRADTAALKDTGRNCIVEGVFEVGGYGLERFFEENDLDYDPLAVVRRVITPAGKSRAYVNDLPVQLTVLKELSLMLIDIHSQHQNRLVGDEDFRIGTVDGVADNRALLSDYAAAYRNFRDALRELERMKAESDAARRDEDYLRYQYEQIRALNLTEDEQEQLEAEQKELANAEQILTALAHAEDSLDRDDTGALTATKSAAQALKGIAEVYPSGEALSGRLQAAYVEMKDMVAEISREKERVEYNPGRLAQVDERLGTIYGLLQKHRLDSARDLIVLRDEIGAKLDTISADGEEIARQNELVGELKGAAAHIAGLLTASRRSAAAELDRGVEEILAELGMPAAVFRCEVTQTPELTPNGADRVIFLFDANGKGQLLPLEKVASGGEVSRLMLAVKSLMARGAKLPTIIFDEIDTGVSGRIADATGEIIASLAGSMQVINITHLPQVASKGDTHFLVFKEGNGPAARTVIKKLSTGERETEIAKMLSGSTVTTAALSQARTLLGRGTE